MKRAVLFDLDGVLLETEPLKARAHSEAVAHFGGDVPPIFYATVMGMAHAEVRKAFMEEGRITRPPEEYSRVFRGCYQRLIDVEARTCPGVPELLTALREQEYAIALVTSSARWMLDGLLDRLFPPATFDVTVSADDVAHHKPAPDCYLRALAQLGSASARAPHDLQSLTGVSSGAGFSLRRASARHFGSGTEVPRSLKAAPLSVAFEDTTTGVAAAAAAGLPVIAVRHSLNATHDLGRAARELPSLEETATVIKTVNEMLSWR